MFFMHNNGWSCQFLESDLKTSLRRKLTFASAAKIREMFDRFSEDQKLEARQALDYAISIGRGSIWLDLTPEQYEQLR